MVVYSKIGFWIFRKIKYFCNITKRNMESSLYDIGNIPMIGYGFVGLTALGLTYATMLDSESSGSVSGSEKESYSDTLFKSTPGLAEATEAQGGNREQFGGRRKKKTRSHGHKKQGKTKKNGSGRKN
jgi:hypothetical protein